MSRLHRVDSTQIQSTKDFVIISRDVKHQPTSVQRTSDGKIWEVGKFVTNGTKMRGYIKEFEFYLKEDNSNITCYVSHTWSGVGMGLEDLEEAEPLTAKFDIKQVVKFKLNGTSHTATVSCVHTHNTKIAYDLDIWLNEFGGNKSTRIHNVDQDFVFAE